MDKIKSHAKYVKDELISFDKAIRNQRKVLLNNFDSIKHAKSLENANWSIRSHFVFPFALAVFNIFDSIFQYVTDHSSEMITHRILPKEFWHHGDIIVLLGFVMAGTIYGNLLRKPFIDGKYCISADFSANLLVLNSKVLNSDLANKLIRFRQHYKRLIQIVFIVMWFEMDSLFVWQLLLSWGDSLRDLFLLIHVPTFFFYGGYANITLICYFLLNVRYIRYIQQHYIATLDKQVEKLEQTIQHRLAAKRGAIWREFSLTQQEIVNLFHLIRGQNRFWCRYLTTYFMIYTIQITYLAYSFFFINTSIDLFHRGFFIFFAVNFVALLSLLTYECSRICENNQYLHKQTAKFYIMFRSCHSFSTKKLIRIDNLASNQQLFGICGFTLLNNYEINSRMFELLFSYITTLFMMILRKKYY